MATKNQNKPKRSNLGSICAAFGCNNYQGTHKEYSYYKFPVKDAERCRKWVLKLRRQDLLDSNPEELKHRVVCSKHFDKTQFNNPESR